MASHSTLKDGTHLIQFKWNGKRETLRLGKVSDSAAKNSLFHVEKILECRLTGEVLPNGTARYLGGLSDDMKVKFAKVGLYRMVIRETAETLGELAEYSEKNQLKNEESTQINMKKITKKLIEFFGSSHLIASITPGDCADFRRDLESKLAETTASETCKKAKSVFELAVDNEWIPSNPFRKMKEWVRVNPDRQVFIDRKLIDRVLKVCCPTWRLITVLVRYGGLRCPSEVSRLHWSSILDEKDRFVVFAPKTKRHKLRGLREVPLFPEIREHLEPLRSQSKPGPMFPRYQGKSNKAMYSAFKTRLKWAGIEAWEKLLQNLRSTRHTELVNEGWPEYLVSYWLGNSVQVAKDHYLQVIDDHFKKAVG